MAGLAFGWGGDTWTVVTAIVQAALALVAVGALIVSIRSLRHGRRSTEVAIDAVMVAREMAAAQMAALQFEFSMGLRLPSTPPASGQRPSWPPINLGVKGANVFFQELRLVRVWPEAEKRSDQVNLVCRPRDAGLPRLVHSGNNVSFDWPAPWPKRQPLAAYFELAYSYSRDGQRFTREVTPSGIAWEG